MTRADIVNSISKETSISKKEVNSIVTLLCKNISKHLVRNETIYFRGFGTFGTKLRKERIARNLQTNEQLLVPEHSVPYFQIGKDLKEIKEKSKGGKISKLNISNVVKKAG